MVTLSISVATGVHAAGEAGPYASLHPDGQRALQEAGVREIVDLDVEDWLPRLRGTRYYETHLTELGEIVRRSGQNLRRVSILDEPITRRIVQGRLLSFLECYKIKSLRDAAVVTERELLRCPNVGRKSVDELVEMLAYGFVLPGSSPFLEISYDHRIELANLGVRSAEDLEAHWDTVKNLRWFEHSRRELELARRATRVERPKPLVRGTPPAEAEAAVMQILDGLATLQNLAEDDRLRETLARFPEARGRLRLIRTSLDVLDACESALRVAGVAKPDPGSPG